MNPHHENSLLSPKSDHSGRGGRRGGNTTATSVSYHSDPFASSNLEEDVQTKDYSYVKSRTPKSETPRPRGFVNDQGSRTPSSNVKAKMACFESPNSFGDDRDDRGDDRAASEWETVAADDEFAPYPEVTTKAQRRQGKSNFASATPSKSSKTDAIVHPHIMSWGQPAESSNPVSRRDPVRQPSVRPEQASSPRLRTFQSSSSLYSELDKKERKGHKQALHSDGAEPDTTYCEGERAEDVLQDEDDLPIPEGLRVQNPDTLKRASAITSSSQGDPFHYDGDRYSDFLRSSVERDVKVPVGRQPEEEPSPEPIQDRRLDGEIVTLLKNRAETQAGTEADWQTVTTEAHPYDSMRQEFHDSIAKGTGSSLADVSDTTERNHHLYEYGSMDRIIQHPSRDVNTGSYRVRNDKPSRLPVLVPQGGGRPGLFAQNATRNLVQSPPRTPASLAGLFRKDGHGQTAKRRSLLLDEERRDSYQTLSSDAGPSKAHDNGESSNAERLFSWPRVNKTLGREPPQTPPTILDKPLYKRDFQGRKRPHVPHDAFLKKTETIHMDLISLPEAAMLQRFRRARGEEDHTVTGAAFAAQKLGGSMNSPLGSPSSATFPLTPTSGSTLPRPAPAHHPERANHNGLFRNSNERITEMLIPSSAILGSTGTDSRFGTNRGWCGDNIQPFNSFSEDEPRFRRGPASTFGRRSDNGRGDRSGVELVDFTWGNVLRRRQQPDDAEDHRQKRIFVSIVILTIMFPFIGVLAIRNKLDAMIPWATEGEMHTLTPTQRRTLKYLLLALAVLYPALITGLVVYYAVHRR
ncbi:uncharacterized protein NECHADRAFT_75219 [Fusarium vanettenii 77-13-4]|uniref:Uncharacterized protein n=1 Tax=Fusarium vanettenii (strain ATCC MYA-4622 / CBS 123669 / FGSC 9596 / NRRL 45880 / 77-13-4) TaxID=660122 RepID=C7YI73_FUSV7|nr:uncharacterized protein NECHADRAFT_75219 [Fusarium vanettenii 77-13-4]EEU48048.1 hypothetical protein NECHADRAFT_75219 [Fusarium vanettenii 77-13-4]